MPNILLDLEVSRIDIVDEGCNSGAFIELYKRKGINMDLEKILESMKAEHAEVIKSAMAATKADLDKALLAQNTLSAEAALYKKKAEEAEIAKSTAEVEKKAAEDALAAEKEEKSKGGASFDEAEVLKSLDPSVQAYIAKMKAQKEAAEAAAKLAAEKAENEEAIAKARKLKSLPVKEEELVAVLKSAPANVYTLLETVCAAIDTSVLQEFGKNKGQSNSSSGDAWNKIEAKAEEIKKSKPEMTKQAAIAEVIKTDTELYKAYLKESE